MGLNRRNFLRRTGWALAGLTAGEFGLPLFSQRYRQILAEPTARKLALLVGINQYRQAPLNGCVTDVALQQELLIHRFGFRPQDILTLTDQQATREAIESAFLSHLVQQARPGSVVVFHFSGYGGIVSDAANNLQPSLVPINDLMAEGEIPVVNDILETTLHRLARSLPTDRVAMVLDTSYTYPGKPLLGNLRVRTRPLLTVAQIGEAEPPFQPQVPTQRSQLSPLPSAFPGVVMAATETGQLATEARWNGFSAGLLTYALTRHLWHTTPATTLHTILGRVKEQVEQLANQEQHPHLTGQKSQDKSLLPYFLPAISTIAADGVVTAVEESGSTAQLWLAGIPAPLLEQYSINSLLVLATGSSPGAGATSPVYLQLLSRDGLSAKARVYRAGISPDVSEPPPTVQVGQYVRERVRVLPRNIGLTVALDSSLERIERVDAISALTTVPRVSTAIAGEQSADYLFSKTRAKPPTQVAATSLTGIIPNPAPVQSSYGLFSLGEDAIPNTLGEGGEAVKVAVRRLVPKLQTLLAAKLLSLTVNETSSQLPVRVTLEKVDPKVEPLLCRETQAIAEVFPQTSPPATAPNGLLTLPLGSRIQLRLENRSAHQLYVMLLGMDSSGSLVALHPLTPPVPMANGVNPPVVASDLPGLSVAAKESIVLPQTAPSVAWVLQGSSGLTETYLLCSRTPFAQTQAALASGLHAVGNATGIYPLTNPLEVAQAVLQDIHQASDTAAKVVGNPPDTYALDVDYWASLRFVYQVVA